MGTEIFVLLIIFGSITAVVKIISDNRIRRLLIEKGDLDENIKYLYSDKFAYAVPTSLKWGMVLVALGLAFLISQFLPVRHDEAMTIALLFIFGGAALVAYYFIGSKMLENKNQ
jgi:hypothetical protein